MTRPSKHDGAVFKRNDGKILWITYRNREGKRIRESAFTEDWQEAQRKLREQRVATVGAVPTVGFCFKNPRLTKQRINRGYQLSAENAALRDWSITSFESACGPSNRHL